jgi:hypothetical protein
MRVHARCVVLIVLALLSLACEMADQSRELDLIYAVVTLPQGFRHEWGGGDTPCGKLVSRDGKTVIEFDLGFYAGTYARPKEKGQAWFRKGVVDSIPYQIALDMWPSKTGVDKILYVTFPDLGPANFWSHVETEDDIDRITKIILELKARKPPKTERKA